MKRRIVSMGAVCVILTGLLSGCIGKDPYVCVEANGYMTDEEEFAFTEQFFYDKQGNITASKVYEEGELYFFTTYQNDKNGNICLKTEYENDEARSIKYDYKNDKVAEVRVYEGEYTKENDYSSLYNITYDQKNRITEILDTKRYVNGEEDTQIWTYEYDTAGEGSQTAYLDGKEYGTAYFYYNKDGLLTESHISDYLVIREILSNCYIGDKLHGFSGNMYYGDTTYEYDENKNIIHMTIDDPEQDVKIEIDYKYMKLSDYLKTQDF